jgi:GntR family transcriptional regulator
VDLTSGRAVYEQIVFGAKKAILRGQLQPEEAFPSVRQISQELGVNPNTAQKAVSALQQEGFVRVIPGIGTVVAGLPEGGREQREHLLHEEIERLVVNARACSLELRDVRAALERHWKSLERA